MGEWVFGDKEIYVKCIIFLDWFWFSVIPQHPKIPPITASGLFGTNIAAIIIQKGVLLFCLNLID